MDKAILKKFAIESRQDLMQKIESKIKLFYVDETFSKQQNGDVYVLINDKHTLSLSKEEYEKRELLIKRINELGLEQVIEEAAYTWFNRIVAIRYMEINDYLPLTKDNQSLGIRVLSSKDNTPDPEIMKFSNLTNPELDIDFKKENYIELKDDNEKYKYVLLLICKKLGRVIPQVFDGVTDYIDILIPDNLLNDSGFINKIINEIPINNYEQVEIIGWLYQYYISEKKEEVDKKVQKKERILKEELPAKTQLFTPDWIVKYMVENTLGKRLNECCGGNSYKEVYKYYIESDLKNDKKNIEDIKFIDPCCGSGHILVYAFELFYNKYVELGYDKRNIASIILSKNIYGLDIDDRAGQLATLALILKARKYDRNLFKDSITINISSVQSSNSVDLLCIDEINENKDIVNYLIHSFIDAKEYGSLIDIEKMDFDKLRKEIDNINNIFGIQIKDKILPLINQADILSNKYDVIVTNPPYLGTGNMSTNLNSYIKKNYPNSKNDMFAAFIEKCFKMSIKNGYYALITQPSILFLNYFEKLRENIIKEQTIISLLHMGRGIFGVDFGSTAFVIKNEKCDNFIGSYYKLHKKVFQLIESENIEKLFMEANNNHNFRFNFDMYNDTDNFNTSVGSGETIYFNKNQTEFLNIPGTPIAYWADDVIGNLFKDSKTIKDYAEPRAGMQTGENEKFVRYWYEVNNEKLGVYVKNKEEAINSNKKWFRYNKGGFFRKWYGNNDFVVNWENDGKDIKEDKLYKLSIGKCLESNSKPKNMQYYFKESLTWSFVSSNAFSIRYSPEGAIFDIAGSSVFPDKDNILYMLGFLASNLSMEFMKLQNPTLNFQVGNVANLPFVIDENIKLEVEELVKNNIEISKKDWDSYERSWEFTKHPLLKYNKNNLAEQFNLWYEETKNDFENLKKNELRLNNLFAKAYKLSDQIDLNIDDKDVSINIADREREIKSLISYAVGCMFGRYSLDKEGLIFAGGEFNENNYKTFKVDTDNIIPITDEAYFSDDIVARFKDFIEVVYGKETLNANLDFIAETLGKKGTETSEETIRRYFLNDFYSDHIKMYQKKPIYWLFDSGKKNGFKALIYMHRYNENTVPKVRLDYLHRVQNTYDKLLTDVNYRLTTELSVSDKKIAQNRQADLNAKLQEITAYDEKIAHIANQRISIDLDDGVTANYSKFADILAKIK